MVGWVGWLGGMVGWVERAEASPTSDCAAADKTDKAPGCLYPSQSCDVGHRPFPKQPASQAISTPISTAKHSHLVVLVHHGHCVVGNCLDPRVEHQVDAGAGEALCGMWGDAIPGWGKGVDREEWLERRAQGLVSEREKRSEQGSS